MVEAPDRALEANAPSKEVLHACHTGNETGSASPSDTDAHAQTSASHFRGETGAFVIKLIGQQRAQSKSQSAAKSSIKWTSPRFCFHAVRLFRCRAFFFVR